MAKKIQESKQKKMAKAQAQSNKEKKKWSSGKQRDLVKRKVYVDEETLPKIQKEVIKMSTVTKGSLAEKFNLNVGVAQRLLDFFEESGMIKAISKSAKLKIYGRLDKVEEVA
ncbi:40S ribosomal S25 [Tubulinosema ratisbonensis]|uniref:40S ribosomal protein S25 n=1 Tax=Tubulinosema ratisbonensis TaxID=291195 RepID=A0A437ANA5_9MICR|nr:40S ribosomal S25 [Tubulinosema ratisbonensis]